jgi:hypothetical protein
METQLVSPYMALFANLTTSLIAFKILDRFIFFGEDVLTEMIVNAINLSARQIVSL